MLTLSTKSFRFSRDPCTCTLDTIQPLLNASPFGTLPLSNTKVDFTTVSEAGRGRSCSTSHAVARALGVLYTTSRLVR